MKKLLDGSLVAFFWIGKAYYYYILLPCALYMFYEFNV